MDRAAERDEFATLVCMAMAESGFENILYDATSFSISLGAPAGRAYLENVYSTYQQTVPAGREAVILGYIATLLADPSIGASFATARASLLPCLRQNSYESLVNLANEARGLPERIGPFAARPLAGGLDIGIARDTETAIIPLRSEVLQCWGVTFDEPLAAAIANLQQITSRDGLAEDRPGLFVGQWADGYDSARLLLTDFIAALPLQGPPVAFVPARDRLFVTGRDRPGGVAEMIVLGETAQVEDNYPLSPDLFLLSAGGWETYVPSDPQALRLWLSVRKRRELIDYSQQKEALDAVNAACGIDIFVASYSMRELDDGTLESYCVWTKDADSLLPETDSIVLGAPEGDSVMVAWNHVVAVAASLMEPDTALLPRRCRVRQFPSPPQFAALKRLAHQHWTSGDSR